MIELFTAKKKKEFIGNDKINLLLKEAEHLILFSSESKFIFSPCKKQK